MIRKIVKFFTKRKKTISEKTIKDVLNKLDSLQDCDTNGLPKDVIAVVEILQGELNYLVEKNYKDKMLNELNGVLVEIIEKNLAGNKAPTKYLKDSYKSYLPKNINSLKEILLKYEKYINKIIANI